LVVNFRSSLLAEQLDSSFQAWAGLIDSCGGFGDNPLNKFENPGCVLHDPGNLAEQKDAVFNIPMVQAALATRKKRC